MKKLPMTKDRLVQIIWLLKWRLGTNWLDQMVTGIGVDQHTILDWSSGKTLPSRDQCRKLADYDMKLRHDSRGNDLTKWFKKGEDLMLASNILKEKTDERFEMFKKLLEGDLLQEGQLPNLHPDVFEQFLMLRSFALECFLKGLIRQKGSLLCKNGKYVGSKHHKLTDYAKDAGFKLTEKENEMLDRLQKHNSLGRYPVLRRFEEEVFWSRIDRDGKCQWREPQDEITFATVLAKIKERTL